MASKGQLGSLGTWQEEEPATIPGTQLACAGTTRPRVPKIYGDLETLIVIYSCSFWQNVYCSLYQLPLLKIMTCQPSSSSPFTLPHILCFAYFGFHPLHCCRFVCWIKEHSNTEETPLFEEEQTGTSCPTFDLDGSELLIFIKQPELLGTVPSMSHDSPTIL